MRTIIEADPCESKSQSNAGISHTNLESQKNKVIDAEKWYADAQLRCASARRHQTPVLIAREDTGVILA